jgi:23S rRNA pseudouridine1911/1915/1917 synthase
MPAQPDPSGDLDLLTWAHQQVGPPLHLVHRIDRPVGGLMVVARHARSAAQWSRRFREGQVSKAYLAITSPPVYPPFGELRHYLKKDPRRHRAQVFYRPMPGAQLAFLRYQTLQVVADQSLVLVELGTGRFHQIRAQLAELGSPLLGDLKYGASSPPIDPRAIALWAWKLDRWTAPPPWGQGYWYRFPTPPL